MGWWDLSEGERAAFTFMALPFGMVSMMVGSRLASLSHAGEVGSMLVILMSLGIGLAICTAFWYMARPLFRGRLRATPPDEDGPDGEPPEGDGPFAERAR